MKLENYKALELDKKKKLSLADAKTYHMKSG